MNKITGIVVTAFAAVVTSCSDSQFEGYTKAENGLHYKYFNHDENATKVQEGDGVLLRYIISLQKNDSVIVDSKDVSRDGTGYTQFGVSKSTFQGSLEDGMMMMCKGDSAEFIISADSFFLKTMRQNELPKGIKQGEHIHAIFKIKNVVPKAELEANQRQQQQEQEAKIAEFKVKERPAIEKYIADNKITVKPTASGLYYIELKKGTGESPKPTDMVKVHYTGKFLDGSVFDSSVQRGEPAEFMLNQVIAGWTEGVGLMKKGGKAQLLCPSEIAYGPQGRQSIPPYSPLFFEVELIDFKPGQEQQAMPAETGH